MGDVRPWPPWPLDGSSEEERDARTVVGYRDEERVERAFATLDALRVRVQQLEAREQRWREYAKGAVHPRCECVSICMWLKPLLAESVPSCGEPGKETR